MKNLAGKQAISPIRQIQTTTGTRNGIRTIAPRLRLGFGLRLGLLLGLGGNQTIAHEENCPRLGLEFGLGLILGLVGNFSREQLS